MSLFRFTLLLFAVLAVVAPWAIGPFIGGIGDLLDALRDGLEAIRDSH